ncbi:MAG: PEP-CTERM sorting domain-containing protein [Armatimonadota bacterium]
MPNSPTTVRRLFPVLKVDRTQGDVDVPKRTQGHRTSGRGAPAKALGAATALLRRCAEEGGEAAARAISRLSALRNAPRQFLADHDVLADVLLDSRGKPTFRFDASSLRDGAGAQGAPVLWACALVHMAASAAGLDERQALLETVAYFEELDDRDKSALLDSLARESLDANGLFARFLDMAAGADEREKIRATAWLRARLRADLPYSSRRVLDAVAAETDLQALRDRVYEAINDTYVREIDEANAERIGDWCRENGIRLVGGRFSRALYIDAMLMAAAKTLPAKAIREPVRELAETVERSTLRLSASNVPQHMLDLSAIGGELQSLANIATKDEVSLAEVHGAADKLRAALREWENALAAALDDAAHVAAADIARDRDEGQTTILRRLAADKRRIAKVAEAVRTRVSEVEAGAAIAPKADPAFVVFFQRLFPLDAINMGLVNELLDPFFGEDEEVHELIRESGHNLYATPNLSAWLRKCDDWIEALPAYATYTIIPQEGGAYKVKAWVQRGILEDMYRRHAEDWALNIEEVMALEHVALARDILVDAMGRGAAVRRLSNKGDSAEAEESVRRFVVEKQLEPLVADLAALVEDTYLQCCVQVAERAERRRLSRMEALRTVIDEEPSSRNCVSRTLARAGKSRDSLAEALRRAVRRRRLARRAREMLPLAGKRRRSLPCVHVLTTLGPGETEMNIANWLEESMALFNVSRAHGLEAEVRERVARHERRLAAVGERLVQELDLEGDLYALMREDGLDVESDEDRVKGILRLLSSYPEVATEAGRLCLLLDRERDDGTDGGAPDDAREPQAVVQYMRDHPELEAEAVAAVIRNNAMDDQVAAYARERSVDADLAAKALVSGDPDCAAELASIHRSLARQRVVASLGLDGQVRDYVRTRLDSTLATVAARREIIGERGLSAALNDPRYRYDATGPFKKYHLLYTPSRVDLGAEEVRSVRNVPKWVGGLDADAANAGAALYGLYNVAGPTPVDSPRLAEFLKVGEKKIGYAPDTDTTINFGTGDASVDRTVAGATSATADATIHVVPEPGTIGLAALGALGLVFRRRSRAG